MKNEKGEAQVRDMTGKKTAKILIIEDDPVAVAILKFRLKARKYHVIVAHTGEEGIKLAHQQLPDLILMDMVLPGLHGLEATIRLKNDPKTKDIPIFAVTAMGSSEFVEACHQDGICVFIKKPYDFRELLKHIHQYSSREEKVEKKVLIINEDPALVTLMASYLKEYGYLVISKPPRMFNVDHVLEVAPDVILLDIDLLEDWGVAIFEILRKTPSTNSIPIILMASQLTSDELKEIAKQLGAEDFVSHHFEFAEVDRKIKKLSVK
ncbi:MAG: response regulator [Candidatus Aminicenantes bacterium]|nr:MAG: response regulator [Candidatus Aminicenantes bacterium]